MKYLLVLFLCLASPAWAGLSSTEKAEIKELHNAAVQLEVSADKLGQMVVESSTANRVRLIALWAGNNSAAEDFRQGVAMLLGVNTDANASAGFAEQYCGTGGCKSNALGHIGTARLTCGGCTLDVMKTNFTSLKDDVGQSATLRALATDGLAAINSAISFVQGFDTTLAYTSAIPSYPDESAASEQEFGALNLDDFRNTSNVGVYGPSRAVIGPHGDYISAVGTFGRNALRFLNEGMDFIKQSYDWVTNGEAIYNTTEFTSFGQMIRRAATINQKMRVMMLAMADIPVDDAGCGLTPTHLIGRTYEAVIDRDVGMPFFYNAMSEEAFATLVEAMATRSTARGLFNSGWPRTTVTAWRYSDGSVWSSFEFPVKRTLTLKTLRQQFHQVTVTHTPPLCVDAINPTVSLTVPSSGANLTKVVTLTATASDNIGIAKVVFSVDGANIGNPESDQIPTVTPFTIKWDSSTVANGSRTIRATAHDNAGNTAFSEVTVNVAN